MHKVHLYNNKTLSSIQWPLTPNGHYAKRYLCPMMHDGTQHYINNVKTTMLALQVDNILLPITINDRELDNSYVCSPYSHYITYAKEELPLIKNPLLRLVLQGFLNGLGKYLRRRQINKVAMVNNWMLSTNLYPSLSFHQLEAITKKLVATLPDHAIVFRSVNDHVLNGLKRDLETIGYNAVVSRRIYFYDPSASHVKSSRDLKQDRKLLHQSGYTIVNHFTDKDLPRLIELYNMLYLDKYSENNPQFSKHFIKTALQNNLLTIKALKKENKLDGVIGYFIRDGIMTTPFFGYDTTYPSKYGLYRMLSSLLVQEATEQQLLLHQSSGAASFKKLRAAYAALEYTMVYTKHLSKNRQRPWSRLSWLMDHTAKPLLEKYEL